MLLWLASSLIFFLVSSPSSVTTLRAISPTIREDIPIPTKVAGRENAFEVNPITTGPRRIPEYPSALIKAIVS